MLYQQNSIIQESGGQKRNLRLENNFLVIACHTGLQGE
jgi:hypothetical protein